MGLRVHAPADRLGDLSVPGPSPGALLDGWIACTGSRLASRSSESATRPNAARDAARSAQARYSLAQAGDLPAELVDEGKALA
jgi:hypothetical protein